MTIGTSTTPATTATDSSSDKPAATASQPRPRGKRRNLTEDQKRELARLYSETDTSLSAIRVRFGIAESSLYRLLQQRGIKVRGRLPQSGTAAPVAATPPVAAAAAAPVASAPAATASTGRGRGGRRPGRPRVEKVVAATSAPRRGGRQVPGR